MISNSRCFQNAVVIGTFSILIFSEDFQTFANWTEAVRAYRAGQRAYDERKWSEAKKEWEAALASYDCEEGRRRMAPQ
jgi:hypothetical protein